MLMLVPMLVPLVLPALLILIPYSLAAAAVVNAQPGR
jgi:hypothetical protein